MQMYSEICISLAEKKSLPYTGGILSKTLHAYYTNRVLISLLKLNLNPTWYKISPTYIID